MQRILVLGSSGKVGQALRHAWRDAPLPGILPVFQARRPGQGIDLVWAPGAPLPPLRDIGAVVALWGVTQGAPRDLARNAGLGRCAQDLARRLGADRVLHASSSAVYAPGPAQREADRPDPQTDYGRAKLAMEQAVRDHGGPRPCMLRMANVRGADSLAPAIMRGRAVLDRFPDGTGPRRSYLSAATLLRVIDRLLRCPLNALPDVINVADPGLQDMGDLLLASGVFISRRAASADAVPVAGVSIERLQRLMAPHVPTPVPRFARRVGLQAGERSA